MPTTLPSSCVFTNFLCSLDPATQRLACYQNLSPVEEGRVVYDNLQKYLRIQIANQFMFILAFLGSSVLAIPGTALFLPLQVLWIHFAIIAPIGTFLGLDAASPGIMARKPRPFNEPLIVRSMMMRLAVVGLYMAIGTLILFQIGKTTFASPAIGQTMALVGLSLMNIFVALNLRFPNDSAFGKATLSNPRLLLAFLWAIVGTMLVTEVKALQQVFATTSLTLQQWKMCLIPGIILLILGEVFKLIARSRHSS